MKKNNLISSFLLTGLFLAISTILSAQESDQKALGVLDKLAEKTNALEGFYTEYSFTMEDLADDENTATYNGKMWYREEGYKLEMMGQTIYTDGSTNWVYQEDIEEVTITDYSEEETSNLIDPSFLLENYSTNYVCRFVADKFEHNRPLVEIHLFPKDIEDSDYSRIILKIDKTKNELYEFTFVGNEGLNFIIRLNSFDSNNSVTADMVKFNKTNFPDADIIDMRD
ncbi:MAG: outer membrane lipoprotein carrier protein LolA [Bacteroidales bacterium]|nr:outer membrane lipoprotein carrier protein LolA [Bacteroidales bacterium]